MSWLSADKTKPNKTKLENIKAKRSKLTQKYKLNHYKQKLNPIQPNQTRMHNRTHSIKLAQKTKTRFATLLAFYDSRPGNGMGLFSKKCISTKVNKEEKSKWGT